MKSAGNLKESQTVCLDQSARLMALIVELKLQNEGYRSFACLVSSILIGYFPVLTLGHTMFYIWPEFLEYFTEVFT